MKKNFSSVNKIEAVSAAKLFQRCDPQQFSFETTNELPDFSEFIGQDRAVDALRFGIDIKQDGYNLYGLGPSGVGKHSLVLQILSEVANKQVTPSDWCYVHNFLIPEKPIAIALPAGLGKQFREDMQKFIEELIRIIPDKIEKETQTELILEIVMHAIHDMKVKYKSSIVLLEYLEAVQKDIVKNIKIFMHSTDNDFKIELLRYKVNLIVDNSVTCGAPVIYEDNPTYSNLIGQAEHVTQLGALITDFNRIKPGALHKANGGYLIIDILKLINQPLVWDALKRALYAKKINIEPPTQSQGNLQMLALDPQSIPLKVKIILLGDRNYYYSLSEQDAEFHELFKVVVDFEDSLDNTPTNVQKYARLIAGLVRKNNLYPFQKNAVARVIEHSSRLVDNSEKLTLHIRSISDLLQEAHYWAENAGIKVVQAEHVQKAIDKQIYRSNRIHELTHEEIQRGTLLIQTSGTKIGQLNVLSVEELGNYCFGYATRVTAIARIGKGEIVDIEREVELGGPIHSKGMLIITGYLAGHYAREIPLSLSATIVFEQNYGFIEGDSASAAELCALLSAVAALPLKQSYAVTGSVNQYGELQPVGAVNEKIEGFFAICKARGLNGDQAVIIPASNVTDLMLNDEVVQAAIENKFHIYAVNTIDEIMELLTDMPAGKRNRLGKFPMKTFNYHIESALHDFAKKAFKY